MTGGAITTDAEREARKSQDSAHFGATFLHQNQVDLGGFGLKQAGGTWAVSEIRFAKKRQEIQKNGAMLAVTLVLGSK